LLQRSQPKEEGYLMETHQSVPPIYFFPLIDFWHSSPPYTHVTLHSAMFAAISSIKPCGADFFFALSFYIARTYFTVYYGRSFLFCYNILVAQTVCLSKVGFTA
jgi:hypothetical protein